MPTCRDINNRTVDWFVLLKQPKNWTYLYMDANTAKKCASNPTPASCWQTPGLGASLLSERPQFTRFTPLKCNTPQVPTCLCPLPRSPKFAAGVHTSPTHRRTGQRRGVHVV